MVVRGKKNDRSDQSGKILPDHQHFAPHRAQKVKVQTAVDDVAAKEVHEDPGAAKEDDCAQNQPAVVDREDHVVLREVVPLAAGRRERRQQHQRNDRQQRQQVKQNRTPAEKVFLNLQTEDRANLPKPERPRQRLLLDVLAA